MIKVLLQKWSNHLHFNSPASGELSVLRTLQGKFDFDEAEGRAETIPVISALKREFLVPRKWVLDPALMWKGASG